MVFNNDTNDIFNVKLKSMQKIIIIKCVKRLD